jgi:hypothetical protein
MKKLLMSFIAVAALATPSAALAHHGKGRHHGLHALRTHVQHVRHHKALLAGVTGTGASLANASAAISGTIAKSDTLGAGTFASTVTTDWTKANTRTSRRGVLSCAPATATLTLTGATTTNTLSASLTGKTCKWTPTGGTTTNAFFGKGTATGAGSAAALNGQTAKAFFVQRSDGTVRGAVFAGSRGEKRSLDLFEVGARDASNRTGHCGDR